MRMVPHIPHAHRRPPLLSPRLVRTLLQIADAMFPLLQDPPSSALETPHLQRPQNRGLILHVVSKPRPQARRLSRDVQRLSIVLHQNDRSESRREQTASRKARVRSALHKPFYSPQVMFLLQ